MGFRRLSVVLGLAGALSACGGVSSPSTNASQTFSGTVSVGAAGPVHLFSAAKTGEYTVTLTALTPTTGNLIGVAFGRPSGSGCGLITTTGAIVGRPALSGGIDKGDYCVQLFDTGSLTAAEAYTITVSHP